MGGNVVFTASLQDADFTPVLDAIEHRCLQPYHIVSARPTTRHLANDISLAHYPCGEHPRTDQAQEKIMAKKLFDMLDPKKPVIAMAAHNPLAAKLAEEAGFDAILMSGFELSATFAVPDASILPMSVHLETTRAMTEVQRLPLLVDMDTGFGNAVNIAYTVPKFVKAGAAAIVIEDRMFPRDSSLREGDRQELIRIEEFQAKIRAAKQVDGITVVARTEALIAGLGEEEALRRGEAYVSAEKDAILIYSKQKTPDEVL